MFLEYTAKFAWLSPAIRGRLVATSRHEHYQTSVGRGVFRRLYHLHRHSRPLRSADARPGANASPGRRAGEDPLGDRNSVGLAIAVDLSFHTAVVVCRLSIAVLC